MSNANDFVIENGVLKKYKGSGGDVVIPDGVTSIDSSVFYGCTGLTSITIPEGVTSIGFWAFYSCKSLTSVNIPDSVSSISDSAFYGCTNLTSINIPDGVTRIDSKVFSGCTSLTNITIPDGVTSIGWNAFEGCKSLTSITIPDSVTSIGDCVFSGCQKITELRLPKGVTYIGRQAFEGTGLNSVICPDSLASIGMKAFSGCSYLEEIIFPDGLKDLAYNLLWNCVNLRKVKLPAQLVSIGEGCFYCCEKLEEISLREGLQQINKSAFTGCSSLTDLHLPEGLTTLGKEAFAYCTGLKSVKLPDTLGEIGQGVFYNCGEVDFIAASPEIIDMVRATDFEIENGTLKKYYGPGGNVTIPENVTQLGEYAFSGCNGLTSVTFTDQITSVGTRCFHDCGIVEMINLSPALEAMMVVDEFEIQNSVLKQYNGMGGDVTIPDGVVEISDEAFWFCHHLYGIRMPESVKRIKKNAFYGCNRLSKVYLPAELEELSPDAFSGCKSLADENGLVIVGDVLFNYYGKAEAVAVPDGIRVIAERVFHSCEKLREIRLPNGLEEIGELAFYGCGLESVTIPKGVKSIGESAFMNNEHLVRVEILDGVEELDDTFARCKKLEYVTLPDTLKKLKSDSYRGVFRECAKLKSIEFGKSTAQLVSNVFGEKFPRGLIKQIDVLYPRMADGALKQYVLEKKTWKKLDPALRSEIFLTKQSKSLASVYSKIIDESELEPLGKAVLEKLNTAKPSAKDCSAAAAYMTLFYEKAPVDMIKSLYERLKQIKSGAKAVKTVEEHVALMEKLGSTVTVDESLSPAAQKITGLLIAKKQNAKDLEKRIKDYYSLVFKKLPALRYADGNAVEPFVFAWLLTVHEQMEEEKEWEQPDVIAGYEKPGLCPEAEEIAALLEPKSLQSALLQLADNNLGLSGRSKKMFLAYPICRYADEELMIELTKRAPKWRSSVSGNDAPPLATFRQAVMYSEAHAAMLFAERYHELDDYAKIRGTDADTIRDCFLSDVGLDEQGGKAYDLGNQTVTARLQKDLSFIVELSNGKTAKSLPKKGADAEKYATANKDFSLMKKNVKKILSSRGRVLFEDFLSGKKRKSDDWQSAYLKNPLLREAASLVVWAQEDKTFTLNANGAIDSAEQPYIITDAPITVAHPMEVAADDISAWQKYFTKHGLKQPFAQVWEPVRDPDQIKEDRYKGCVLEIYQLNGKDKHGIRSFGLHAYSEEFGFTLDDCKLEYETSTWRLDWNGAQGETYKLGKFSFKKFTRKVNHIVTILDGLTVSDRIAKDDVSVIDMMQGFTLAQITEFITEAQAANAVNVLAALLEYKNNNFADFDPMDEFTLEW